MIILNICVAAFNRTNIPIDPRLDWTRVGSGCVGAKDDSYVDFTYPGPSKTVTAIKLSHTKGRISCQAIYDSYWGCKPTDPKIGMVIHLIDNNKIVPRCSKIDAQGFYKLPGYTSMSTSLEFRAPVDFESFYIQKDAKIRVWYGEDLYRPDLEYDNRGQTCFDMYLS